MTAVLLQPHSDDCALFASFLALRHQPHVVTVFRSVKQEAHGVSHQERIEEDARAFDRLGLPSREWWDFRDDAPDWPGIAERIHSLASEYDVCVAPCQAAGEPHQHVGVGKHAAVAFGAGRVVGYTTYLDGGVRNTAGVPVEFEPDWVFRKLAALSCYRSQARTPSIKHFLEPLTEYVV